jgi:hypothetical protein
MVLVLVQRSTKEGTFPHLPLMMEEDPVTETLCVKGLKMMKNVRNVSQI